MATKRLQLPPLQGLESSVGMAPVMSSRSTLRNEFGLREVVRAAIRIGYRLAARRAGGEAIVDPIAVGMTGDDEKPLFGVGGGAGHY